MKNRISKNIYRVLLVASFLAINALILSGISALLAYLNTGADKSSMLHLEVPMEKVYAPKITWGTLDNPGRTMEKQTLQEIERDYLNAWHVRNVAYKKNDRYGVSDFYTDSARARIFEHIDLNIENNNSFHSTTLAHFPELDFYSEDGTLVVFTDKNVERYQEIYEGDSLLAQQKDTTSYQIMMLLEDGFWRVRHMQEIETDSIVQEMPERDVDSISKTVAQIKGINYYPQKTPWDTFGKAFNDTIIGKDFSLIKEMGLNTIRIFIQYEDFGKAEVKLEKLKRLKKTMDLAFENDLKVLVTLFDFYGDYDISNWTLTQRHAKTIVTDLKDHPTLLGWDVKNEPDLDFDARGKDKVLAWLKETTQRIKKWDPNHLVTIGWSNAKSAELLKDDLDFVSFHYYNELSEFSDALAQLKSAVPNKPLLLQEYGFSSYGGLWNAFSGSEKEQALYYEEIQTALKKEQIPFLFWTLYDFEEIPSSVVGQLPWRKERQAYFGILDTEGKQKASYQHLLSY